MEGRRGKTNPGAENRINAIFIFDNFDVGVSPYCLFIVQSRILLRFDCHRKLSGVNMYLPPFLFGKI